MASSVLILAAVWLVSVPLVLGVARALDALASRRRSRRTPALRLVSPPRATGDNVVPLLPRPRNAVVAATRAPEGPAWAPRRAA